MYSRNTLKMASSFFKPSFSTNVSTSFLKSVSCLATIEFKVVIAFAQFAVEPTARNSNLFPVKAKGEVRLRSVLSNKTSGDRKSTRLNSSHVKISYAVFCLKKKIQRQDTE